MSAITNGIPLVDAQPGVAPKLPPKALVYYALVAAVTGGMAAPLVARLDGETRDWATFAALALAAAAAQLFVVRMPPKSYHTTGVFLHPGRAPSAAGTRGADRARTAPPRVAQEPFGLVHPELQRLRLHAGNARRMGRGARRARR